MSSQALTTPPPTPKSGPLASSPTAPKPALNDIVNTLTPPTSPIKISYLSSKHSRSSLTSRPEALRCLSTSYDEDENEGCESHQCPPEVPPLPSSDEDEVTICPFKVDSVEYSQDQRQVLGYGAWSVVLKSSAHATTSTLHPAHALPQVVAVKQPARLDAMPILANEAKIMSYLSHIQGHSKHVATFYGVVAAGLDRKDLVMEALPLSLEDYVKRRAHIARHTLTTLNMSQPVVGSCAIWLSLAESVISGLAWLHGVAGVVHGDIKPGNFMLRQIQPAVYTDTSHNPEDANYDVDDNSSFAFQPVFIDFSSSHRVDANAPPPPLNTLSAVTREYTAPELLVSSVLRDPKATATKQSDVFSLAVTLLVAATGNTMVYEGSVFQRQAMATRGWQVLDFARSSSSLEQGAARVPRHGIVDRALDKAVLKADYGPSNGDGLGLGARISACQWLHHVQQMRRQGGEPNKQNGVDSLCKNTFCG